MHPHRFDPAPRQYAANIELNARAANGLPVAGTTATPADVETWLLGEALLCRNMLDLAEAFCWRLVAAGLPVTRLAFSAGTLHPQLLGHSWIWEADDGLCDEIRIHPDTLEHPSYLKSPLYLAIEHGETVHGDPRDPAMAERFPIMGELAERGFKDYLVMPLTSIEGLRRESMTVTMASVEAGGLSGPSFEIINNLVRLLAIHVARLMALLVSENIAIAYLGRNAARQVLDGSITRGTGAPLDAMVLVSDMRGFTELSSRLTPQNMLALLNAYFEALVAAIQEQDGEVLKFMGDGLLAVFTNGPETARRETARQAFAAACNARDRIARLSAEPPEPLAGISGLQPLRIGLALHTGEVFFGNIGSPDHLDFTVIGPAVNVAARVEAMTKELGRPLLVTEPVAALLDNPMEALGSFHLRGISDPVQLFAPPLTNTETPQRP